MEEGYGQFCTVARGAEILCERWTPLVVRELLCGSRRFNDLHRGVPRMSTSLLAQRLRQLEECGVVCRTAAGKVWEYSLTEAGEELRPIVMGLGQWGARWIGSRLRENELDAGLLMWDIRRSVHLAEVPPHEIVVQFCLRDARAGERRWWLVIDQGTVDLCRDDPGRDPAVVVDSTLRALTELWAGDCTPQEERSIPVSFVSTARRGIATRCGGGSAPARSPRHASRRASVSPRNGCVPALPPLPLGEGATQPYGPTSNCTPCASGNCRL